MKLIDAKEQVKILIDEDINKFNIDVNVDWKPPGKDIGKFSLKDKTARVIAPFNGFFVNINLGWFDGSNELPQIQREKFYWYVFALKGPGQSKISDYYICDFIKMKKWVLEFEPTGHDHKDHADWRGQIEILGNQQGYFRWGDEKVSDQKQSRYINLNNIVGVAKSSPITSYLPQKEDFEDAYRMIAKVGKEVPINSVLDQIEKNAKNSGHVLKENWRYITLRNIKENW